MSVDLFYLLVWNYHKHFDEKLMLNILLLFLIKFFFIDYIKIDMVVINEENI